MSAKSKPKIQHWVPRCYLRHFATPETRDSERPLVWIFSKEEGDSVGPVLTGINTVAGRRYLYSPRRQDGNRDYDMETRLADLEGVVADIWPTLADGFADLCGVSPLRKITALFVATLHLRHPQRLAEVAALHRQMVDWFETFPKDGNGNPLIQETPGQGVLRGFDSSGYQQYKAAAHDETRKTFVDTLKQSAITCAEALMKKRWSVVFSERPVFITTDTPVMLVNQGHARFGLKTPGTTVSIPLSPTRLLIMDDLHDQPEGQYYPLAAAGPAPFNLEAWRNCERFMISPRQTDSVCAEMLAWADLHDRPGRVN